MITTMICIWWLLFACFTGAAGWFGFEAWKAGGETEGWDFFGYSVATFLFVLLAILAWFTIAAIKAGA